MAVEQSKRGLAKEIRPGSIKHRPYRAGAWRNQMQGRKKDSLIAWRKVVRTIAKQGFLKEADIPWRFAMRLTDPESVNPPARVNSLSGIAHLSGGRHRFSTVDLLGKRLYRTQYIVVNEDKFRRWASTWMETNFRVKNPHPDRLTTAAFTRYMHDNNLHWSGCTDRRRGMPDTSDEWGRKHDRL